jgi:hypothetical protein
MPARWKLGLAVLGVVIAGQVGAEPPAPQALISSCRAQVDGKATGIAALSRSCPGLRQALDQLRLISSLPPGWQKTLSTNGLADVSALAQRYAGSPASAAPKVAALRFIAAGLVLKQPPPTWWDKITARIGHWIGSVLHPMAQWLRSLGPALRRASHPQAIFFGLIVLLFIAVGAVLAFALHGTGLIRPLRRAASRPRHKSVAAGEGESGATPFREPDWARLREHPARLLRLLVDTLTRTHQLEREGSLTCRELETEARFETELDRAGFARVARLAERELYGPPGGTVLAEDVLRDARLLHERLLATAGKTRGIR